MASDIQPIMRRVKIHRRSRMETPLRRNLTAYTFLLPWFTGMLCLTVGAMLFTFYLAFTDYDLISSPEWVGFDNFQQILRDPNFWISIRATFTYVIFSVPARLIVSLLIALLLYREVRGIGWYRSLIYLPSLIGTSVGAAIGWRNLFADDGPVNAFLGLFGVEGPNWVGNPSTAIVILILLSVWQFGSEMVIFLAGLKQIPGYLYEAAIIDGASAIQRFFKITLPMLSPITFFNLLMGTISSFMIFTQVYIITGGGPMKSTLMYVYYLYQHAFNYYNMGYAAALSIILLIIIGLCSTVIFLSSRFWVHYDG